MNEKIEELRGKAISAIIDLSRCLEERSQDDVDRLIANEFGVDICDQIVNFAALDE